MTREVEGSWLENKMAVLADKVFKEDSKTKQNKNVKETEWQ